MKTNNNNPTSFGWHYKNHADIVRNTNIAKSIDKSILETLETFVQKPDFDEFFLYGQKHFYYPNDKIKSFLDYTGTHNAKSVYKEHLSKMNKFFSFGKLGQGLEEAGRALHYLQDVTQSHHIDSGSIIKKAKDAVNPHHSFEMFVNSKIDFLLTKTKPIELKANSFETLFDEVINLSKANEIPSMKNINDWEKIAQDAMNIATAATQKFIELLHL